MIYEEVARMPPFQRKSLILVGAQGVGRRTLRQRLCKSDPSRYGSVVPRKLQLHLLEVKIELSCFGLRNNSLTIIDDFRHISAKA